MFNIDSFGWSIDDIEYWTNDKLIGNEYRKSLKNHYTFDLALKDRLIYLGFDTEMNKMIEWLKSINRDYSKVNHTVLKEVLVKSINDIEDVRFDFNQEIVSIISIEKNVLIRLNEDPVRVEKVEKIFVLDIKKGIVFSKLRIVINFKYGIWMLAAIPFNLDKDDFSHSTCQWINGKHRICTDYIYECIKKLNIILSRYGGLANFIHRYNK